MLKNNNAKREIEYEFPSLSEFAAYPRTALLRCNNIQNIEIKFEPRSLGKYFQRSYFSVLGGKFKIPLIYEGFCFEIKKKKLKPLRGMRAYSIGNFTKEFRNIQTA